MNTATSSRGAYLVAFGALLLLLALTVAVAHLHLGEWSPVAALGIAVAKVVLIGLVFMHLKHETPLVRIFSVAGLLWLAILLVFVASDYLTRTAVTPISVTPSHPEQSRSLSHRGRWLCRWRFARPAPAGAWSLHPDAAAVSWKASWRPAAVRQRSASIDVFGRSW